MASIVVPLNIRNVAIMVLKNAVNAAVLSGIEIFRDPMHNNIHTMEGVKNVLWVIGAAVLAREGTILIPRVIKWSQTNGAV